MGRRAAGTEKKSLLCQSRDRLHGNWECSYNLALLWQFWFDGIGEEFLTMRAPLWRRPREEVEDGLPDGRHARLWRRSPDSFFSVPLL